MSVPLVPEINACPGRLYVAVDPADRTPEMVDCGRREKLGGHAVNAADELRDISCFLVYVRLASVGKCEGL